MLKFTCKCNSFRYLKKYTNQYKNNITELIFKQGTNKGVKGQPHIIELSGVEVFVLQVLADVTSGAKHSVCFLVDLTQVIIAFRL